MRRPLSSIDHDSGLHWSTTSMPPRSQNEHRLAVPSGANIGLPPSLSGYTPAAIKALKQNILTEHFGWAPESFAKQGNDIANNAMYAAAAIVEASLEERSSRESDFLDDDEIQLVRQRSPLPVSLGSD